MQTLAGSAAKAETMRVIAAKVLEFGGKPFTDALRGSGALNDASVIVNLALQGLRMVHRGGLRG